jgi:hypothetical protein
MLSLCPLAFGWAMAHNAFTGDQMASNRIWFSMALSVVRATGRAFNFPLYSLKECAYCMLA